MKSKSIHLFLFFCTCTLHCALVYSGQTTQQERLCIPFLNKQSQSNVVVSICDFEKGQPCPYELTNSLSNTNLFPLKLQEKIRATFTKYKTVTPTQGPPGTIFVNSYKTNIHFTDYGLNVNTEATISIFKYTNSDSREVIKFGAGLLAEYRNSSNDGYDAAFTQTGSGTLLGFNEVRSNQLNGIFARFDDSYAQGMNWDFRKSHFTGNGLCEYHHYTNGYVIGRCFMWNVNTGNLQLQADFRTPYDWKKNYIMPKL